MAKLTTAQIKALQKMVDVYGGYDVQFATGEALRKRGLADRYTETITRAEYVTVDSVTPQRWCSPAEPGFRHDWYITPAGRAALQEASQ